jgi:putative two-component system response regulator
MRHGYLGEAFVPVAFGRIGRQTGRPAGVILPVVAQLPMHDAAPVTILIADDDAAIRLLLRATLERAGYRVIEADDGEGALIEALRHRPELVLLDVNMPGISGIEVVRRLRQEPDAALLPIILVTALAAVDDKVRGLEAGATDFVTKPFQQAELIARVRACLRTQAALNRLESAQGVLVSLANAVEAKDPTTEHHCSRLAEAALSMARSVEAPEEMVEAIGYGAVLHDVGKIGVSERILLKPGELTEDEWVEMRRHPIIGATIIEPLLMGRLVAPIIRHHHEQWDGSGYPDGLRGNAIPLGARIVAVADSYDAMIHDRPYRPAISAEEAVEELLAKSGSQFDGDLVRIFIERHLNRRLEQPSDALAAYTHGLYQTASA